MTPSPRRGCFRAWPLSAAGAAFTATAAAALAALACAGAGALRDPSAADPRSPDVWRARFETTAGDFVVEVHREWAPRGADRFHRLVRAGYYESSRIFRVIPGYIVQFGIAGDPRLARSWRYAYLPDEPSRQPCAKGMIAFADKAPNTRATQVFVNLTDNPSLDTGEFAPFGRVIAGMDVVARFHGYGRAGPQGERTDQSAIFEGGNAWLDAHWPGLDTIVKAGIVWARGD